MNISSSKIEEEPWNSLHTISPVTEALSERKRNEEISDVRDTKTTKRRKEEGKKKKKKRGKRLEGRKE